MTVGNHTPVPTSVTQQMDPEYPLGRARPGPPPPPAPSSNNSSLGYDASSANNKPCNGCRRRKVRCDKGRPSCLNCSRHGETCVYEGPPESGVFTAETQQRMQDRLERLERLVQGMNFTGGPSTGRDSRLSSTEAVIQDWSPESNSTVESEDQGVQLTEPNNCYYMHPNFWLNLEEFVDEPRDLLRWPYDDKMNNNWPFSAQSIPPILTESLTALHLPVDKQDALHEWFYKAVDPWIRATHYRAYMNEVSNFRIGKSTMPREIEALMFSVHAVTVAAMSDEQVQQLFGRPREHLLSHFQFATELAMNRANFLRTRNMFMFMALLHYITFLFHTGQPEKATSLLGTATRIGMRLGLHKDPSSHLFTPWVAEMRRRLWTYFLVMDQPTYNSEGAESLFDTLPWVPRPVNANDNQWPPHRFMKPEQVPADADGFTDMAFANIRRELYYMSREVGRLFRMTEPERLLSIITDCDNAIRKKYIDHMNVQNPMQAVIIGYYSFYHRCLRINVEVTAVKSRAQSEMPDDLHTRILATQLDLFEDLARTEAIAQHHNWQWIFKWPPPFHGIARLLHSLAEVPKTTEAERAWKQVDLIFRRHLGSDMAMQDVPSWRLIERLCDIAMFAHSGQAHQGAAYTLRGESRHGTTDGSETATNTGLSLVNQLAYPGLGTVSWNSPTPGPSTAHSGTSNSGGMMQYTSAEGSTFQP
ncbi:hypothetical protein PG990_010162 [Apiospora arundinis]